MAALRYDRRRATVPIPEPTLFGASRILNGVPNLSEYRDACLLPPGAPAGYKTLHPGRVLPGLTQTTQALFGVSPVKCGTTAILRKVADMIPKDAPRFLCHDATSMSTSLSSYYKKTNLGQPTVSDEKGWKTQYTDDYKPEMGLERTYNWQLEAQYGTRPEDMRRPPAQFKGWHRQRA